MNRSFQAALAAWIEEQSGLSLLTPEGESHASYALHASNSASNLPWRMRNSSQCCGRWHGFEYAGTLPLEKAPGTALAWETLSAQDKARRPGHAVTDAKRELACMQIWPG